MHRCGGSHSFNGATIDGAPTDKVPANLRAQMETGSDCAPLHPAPC